MHCDYRHGCASRDVIEHPQRHQRVFGDLPLAVDKQKSGDDPEDDQTNDLGRRPGKDDAAKVETEKQHHREHDDSDAPQPVNGAQAIEYRGAWRMDVQKEP